MSNMRLEESLFNIFIRGIQEWIPSYYSKIMDNLYIDTAGYRMGFDKEPMYIFEFNISNDEIRQLEILSSNLKTKSKNNGVMDEELFEKYDRLAGFVSLLHFNLKN